MNKLILRALALVGLCIPFFASATVWTCSNNPDRPAQFTSLQAAVDAASPSDSILVTGSATSYGTVNMVKNLVIYGEAIEGTDFPITIIGSLNLQRFNSSLSSSGSRFYGLQINSLNVSGTFSGGQAGQQFLEDYIFERCRFAGVAYMYPYDGLNNITFRNCLFKDMSVYMNQTAQNPAPLSGIIFTNNIFENTFISAFSGGGSYDMNGNVVMRNSLFLDRTTSTFSSMQELVVENCIFYACEPTGLNVSTFNNNITYLCNSNTLPYGDNLGSGNIINQNPLFVNYPALGGNHSWAYDYTLQAGSPGLGTGTNGTDIGLGGGNAPVANLPRYAKIPGVTLLEIPVSSVPVGGTLQINIEAESRD